MIRLLLFVFLALSCEENDCCVNPNSEGGNKVEGSWLLYETGYSPGWEYVTTPVSPLPPQIVSFRLNGEMSSNMFELAEYQFYSISGNFIELFKTDPRRYPDRPDISRTYFFSLKDGNLRLGYINCIEGCHLGLKKLK